MVTKPKSGINGQLQFSERMPFQMVTTCSIYGYFIKDHMVCSFSRLNLTATTFVHPWPHRMVSFVGNDIG